MNIKKLVASILCPVLVLSLVMSQFEITSFAYTSGNQATSTLITKNVALTITENAVSKPSMAPSIDANLTNWIFDPNTNKFKLNITINGQSMLAPNGFIIVNESKTKVVNGILTQVIVQNIYYIDEVGNMVTGCVKTVDDVWYFFENAKVYDEGKMVYGWRNIQNAWYYFGDDGGMVFGWNKIQGDWYYFEASGKLLVNATTSDGYKVGVDGKRVD